MAHTAQSIDFAERLRSLSVEPSPDKEHSASADQPTPVEKKRSVARGLLAIALIGSVIGAAGYLLTTNTPQIADLRSDAATLLNGLTRLSEKQPEPQIQTQHLSTSEHAASPIKESRLPSPIEPMTSSAEMPVIGSGYSRAGDASYGHRRH